MLLCPKFTTSRDTISLTRIWQWRNANHVQRTSQPASLANPERPLSSSLGAVRTSARPSTWPKPYRQTDRAYSTSYEQHSKATKSDEAFRMKKTPDDPSLGTFIPRTEAKQLIQYVQSSDWAHFGDLLSRVFVGEVSPLAPNLIDQRRALFSRQLADLCKKSKFQVVEHLGSQKDADVGLSDLTSNVLFAVELDHNFSAGKLRLDHCLEVDRGENTFVHLVLIVMNGRTGAIEAIWTKGTLASMMQPVTASSTDPPGSAWVQSWPSSKKSDGDSKLADIGVEKEGVLSRLYQFLGGTGLRKKTINPS